MSRIINSIKKIANLILSIKDKEAADKIAFAAFILSICSLFVTSCQGHASYKHNVMSVKPYLSFINTESSISIENNGLGPAIVTEMFIIIDGNESFVEKKIDIENILLNYKVKDKYSYTALTPDTPLKSGSDPEPLISSETKPDSLDRIKFRIVYEDIYGNNYEVPKSKKFFGF